MTEDIVFERPLSRLHAAINKTKPENGFIKGALAEAGWTAQPDYRFKRHVAKCDCDRILFEGSAI